MPAAVRRPLTVDDLQAMHVDEGMRLELIRGELFVSPAGSPRHELVRTRLLLALGEYLAALGLGDSLLCGATELSWGRSDTSVDPDIWVADLEERRKLSWKKISHAHLVIEIVSPSSQRRDRVIKRGLYAEMRVGTYWIIDPVRHQAEVMHAGDSALRRVTSALEWRVRDDAPHFSMPLDRLFEGVPLGEG